MFGKKEFKREELSVITNYTDEYYEELQDFINAKSIGAGDLDLKLPREKFSELMTSENFKYFLIVKYEKRILAFSLGILPRNDANEKIESIIAFDRKAIHLDSMEFAVGEIGRLLRGLSQNTIIIHLWSAPSGAGAITRSLKKLGFVSKDRIEWVKEIEA